MGHYEFAVLAVLYALLGVLIGHFLPAGQAACCVLFGVIVGQLVGALLRRALS